MLCFCLPRRALFRAHTFWRLPPMHFLAPIAYDARRKNVAVENSEIFWKWFEFFFDRAQTILPRNWTTKSSDQVYLKMSRVFSQVWTVAIKNIDQFDEKILDWSQRGKIFATGTRSIQDFDTKQNLQTVFHSYSKVFHQQKLISEKELFPRG